MGGAALRRRIGRHRERRGRIGRWRRHSTGRRCGRRRRHRHRWRRLIGRGVDASLSRAMFNAECDGQHRDREDGSHKPAPGRVGGSLVRIGGNFSPYGTAGVSVIRVWVPIIRHGRPPFIGCRQQRKACRVVPQPPRNIRSVRRTCQKRVATLGAACLAAVLFFDRIMRCTIVIDCSGERTAARAGRITGRRGNVNTKNLFAASRRLVLMATALGAGAICGLTPVVTVSGEPAPRPGPGR